MVSAWISMEFYRICSAADKNVRRFPGSSDISGTNRSVVVAIMAFAMVKKKDLDETHFSWILAIESPEFYGIL